ncbi:MAG: HipA domain-containing protein [Microcella sp.]|uniref:type II toxin-antitoxin system HipA family toxin n=1 Tax=Microcella sp. TaxID=1913979 RepID=UPI003315951E
MASISSAFVWVWLSGDAQPVPAGRLQRSPDGLVFDYGRRYLERPGAVSLAPTLPLGTETFGPTADLGMPGALRDGAPDAWGRRVILHALTGRRGRDADVTDLDELTYLMASGSNRLGAIDFQASSSEYVPRADTAALDELNAAAQTVDAGGILPENLAAALIDGTAMGGARPKALIVDDGVEFIAKFSTTADVLPVVGAEAASLALARRVGVRVPASRVERSLGKDVLLVERFDRPGNGTRSMVVSALTLSGLGEMTARYGSYLDLLATLREWGDDAGDELYRRIALNIAISNTDDHLRNHAAFWDGRRLRLTPAYDLSPMNRSGETASQALPYGPDGERASNLAELARHSPQFGLSRKSGLQIVQHMVDALTEGWQEAADEARLTTQQRRLLWGRQFLNPGALHGLP